MPNRANKKPRKVNSKEDIYGEDNHLDGFETQTKPINWKKTIIGWGTFLTIITGIVLIWLFALRGKDYLDYKKVSKDYYSSALVSTNEDSVKNYSFIDDVTDSSKGIVGSLKDSALKATADLKSIYDSNGGFTYGTEHHLMFGSYDYEIGHVSSTDYVFTFENKSLTTKYNNAQTANGGTPILFPIGFTSMYWLRIMNGKIAAIGYQSSTATTYSTTVTFDGKQIVWLNGSYTDGMDIK